MKYEDQNGHDEYADDPSTDPAEADARTWTERLDAMRRDRIEAQRKFRILDDPAYRITSPQMTTMIDAMNAIVHLADRMLDEGAEPKLARQIGDAAASFSGTMSLVVKQPIVDVMA